MKGLTAVLILALSPAFLWAGDPTFILADGEYYFAAEGEGLGIPIADAFPVIVLSDAPPDDDPDDDDDPKDEPTELSERVQAWAEEIDHPIGATILAAVYGALGDSVGSGDIPATTTGVDTALTTARVEVMKLMPGNHDAEWTEFMRGDVVGALGELNRANGGDLTKSQYVKFFADVEAGLSASTAGEAIPTWLQPFIDALIAALIQILLGLF